MPSLADTCIVVIHAAGFADMSWEEFGASRLGAAQNCSATLKGNHQMAEVVLPDTVIQIIKTLIPILLLVRSAPITDFEFVVFSLVYKRNKKTNENL